jgi:hypothetical protein
VAPLTEAKPAQAYPCRSTASRRLHPSLHNAERRPGFSSLCRGQDAANQRAPRLPNEVQSPNSLSTSSCAIPADGWARAASIRANMSPSTGASRTGTQDTAQRRSIRRPAVGRSDCQAVLDPAGSLALTSSDTAPAAPTPLTSAPRPPSTFPVVFCLGTKSRLREDKEHHQ